MSAATAQLNVNTNESIPLSFAVTILDSLPRWPSKYNNFDFSRDYILAVLLSSLIPLIIGLCLSALLLVHIIIRFTCRRQTTDIRFHKLNKSKLWTVIQSLISIILFFVVFGCVSVGVVGNAGLNASAQDTIDILKGLLTDVRFTGLALVDIGLLLRRRLEAFQASDAEIPNKLTDEFGNVFEDTLNALQSYALMNYPQLDPLRQQVDALAKNISRILEDVRVAMGMLYAILLAFILVLTLAPLLLHVGHWIAMSKHRRPTRAVFYILYMILVTIAWLLAGGFSSIGIATADVCRSVHEYRSVLLGEKSRDQVVATSNNPLVKSGFTCANVLDPERLVSQIDDTATSILQNELAKNTIQLLLNTSSQDVADAAKWSGNEVRRYVDCSALIEFSGVLELVVCGEEGQPIIEGVYDLWIAFLGLAIFLMVGLFVSLLGFNMARWFDVTHTGVVKGWNTVISGRMSEEQMIDGERNGVKDYAIDMGR